MLALLTGQNHRSAAVPGVVLLAVSGVLLVGLQEKVAGWSTLLLGLLSLALLGRRRAKQLFLPYLVLAILGVTPIDTRLTNVHMATMGLALAMAIVGPTFLDRKWSAGDPVISFPWRMGRRWSVRERVYLALTIAVAYLLLPYYLRETGAYLNWHVQPRASSIVRLFIGTNAVGLWDELAFVIVTLSALRRFLPFYWANLGQTILFTSFLYELGFTGWGVFFIFPFAYVQGVLFRFKQSLSYVVSVHLSLDLVLFLAIVNTHHPHLFAIFIT